MTERPTPPLKIGGLFFGYGGLDMAVSQVLDAELAWVSEFDKGTNKIIEHRYPGVPNIGDITKVDWSQVEPVDVITGGSPCQDLSHAGRRAGMTEGTRSNLWVSMREAIAVLKPKLVIWENVRGAYSAAANSAVEPCPGCVGDGPGVHLRALGRVLGDLSDLGYDAQWHGLRAADVGAPHGRFRVFVAAYADGGLDIASLARADQRAVPARDGRSAVADSMAALLPAPTVSDSNGARAHGDGGLDLRTAIGMLPTPQARELTLLPTPAAQEPGGTAEQYHARLAAHDGRDSTFLPLSMAVQLLPSAVQLMPTPSVADVMGGRKSRSGDRSGELLLNGIAAQQAWGQYAEAIQRWEQITRPAPPPTELGPKGSPRLSARFSEWMMGLPDGWITDVPGITRNEALKACGNGVVPQQATYALRLMLQRATELTSAPAHVGAFSSLEDQ